jgi:uncharacterized protein with FMN-binding domain
MKKFKGFFRMALIVLVSLIALTACSGGASEPVVETKTLTGTGTGYAGEVVVEVTVEGDTITAIEVVESSDTPGLSDGAYDAIIPAVIENQSVEGVDAVSGATGSSEGILEAIADALSQM